jgi:hypothetical protein
MEQMDGPLQMRLHVQMVTSTVLLISQDTKDCASEIKEGNAPAMTQVAHVKATNETSWQLPHSPGYDAGQIQGDDDWGHAKLHTCAGGIGYCPASCPPGHSAEYCLA